MYRFVGLWNGVPNYGAIDSYVWGLDLPQSMQGAGGVGGLLAWTKAGATNETCFYGSDANGNVSVLVDADNDTLRAQYEYSPFGVLISQTGDLAGDNPFRFSTNYTDGSGRISLDPYTAAGKGTFVR